jgi:uncharacterized membrane protein
MHTLLDVLHVVAAVFLVGPLAILPMTAMRALRAGQGSAVASLARSTWIFALASLLVVVFGFGVMGTSDPQYKLTIGTPWIWISIVLYLIALALTCSRWCRRCGRPPRWPPPRCHRVGRRREPLVRGAGWRRLPSIAASP